MTEQLLSIYLCRQSQHRWGERVAATVAHFTVCIPPGAQEACNAMPIFLMTPAPGGRSRPAPCSHCGSRQHAPPPSRLVDAFAAVRNSAHWW